MHNSYNHRIFTLSILTFNPITKLSIMQSITFSRDLFFEDDYTLTAPDEGCFQPPVLPIEEEFSGLIAHFSETLRQLPAGDLRDHFTRCLHRIEYLRLRVESEVLPLPF